MASTSILIVEDEGILAAAMQMLLSQMGYTICGIAPSGRRALDLAAKNPPALVFMDIKLRGAMDGIEAARLISNMYKSTIVFVSAHSDPETKARAMKTRPAAFITKPVEEYELKRILSEVFPK
jgi:CheY-like chemotaxis protein